jgi:hypothetical protein
VGLSGWQVHGVGTHLAPRPSVVREAAFGWKKPALHPLQKHAGRTFQNLSTASRL